VFQAPSPRNEIESTRIGFLVLKKIGKIYGGKTYLGTGISVGKETTFTVHLPVESKPVEVKIPVG